ncbi:MAG TPA: type II secretion system protein GspG [Candidatus Polarisedimenticolaceae bacterium]|nr:type II secretion system protein GspG [Candidatus Polarisedimenticolaceae bacterium]
MRTIFFTLISLIGLFCSAAVSQSSPHPPPATDQERAGWTLSDMRTLGTAIEAYAVDHGGYPKAAGLDALIPLIQPVYIRRAPVRDAWGNAYVYVPAADGKAYRIVSAGSDGKTDPATWDVRGEQAEYEADAVLDSGSFSRGWRNR